LELEFVSLLMDINPEVLSLNVRGLNDPAKRNTVREFVATLCVNVVCFQETKIEVFDDFLVS
jgi:exonuclease III